MMSFSNRTILAFIAVVNVAFLSFDMLIPAVDREIHNAQVLSKTGPKGQAAYRQAIADDVISRRDMRRIRAAAGQDIDAQWDLVGKDQPPR